MVKYDQKIQYLRIKTLKHEQLLILQISLQQQKKIEYYQKVVGILML